MMRFGGEDLHLVATLQSMTHGHQLMVHLGTNTMRAQEGVDREGEIEHCTIGRHRLDLALRRKDKDFAGKEVQLNSIEEVHGIRLGIIKNLLDGAQPFVQLILILSNLALSAILVFPVGCQSLLGNLVHTIRANLHLNPMTLFRHQCHMKCLIAIGLRMTEPVACSIRMTLIDFRQCHIDVKAFVDFLLTHLRRKDDTHSQDIIDLIERHMLLLHLIPNRIRRFHAFANLVFNTHLMQHILDRCDKLVERLMSGNTCLLQLLLNKGIFLRMFELKT